MLTLVLASLVACSADAPDQVKRANRPPLHIMSALPLFQREGQEALDLGLDEDQRSLVLRSLSDSYAPTPVDFISKQALARVKLFILAQPRGLQPAELVALDGWVRAGGRLLVFADPKLDWPSRYPLGDKRRPPFTSLLDPLFRHWGLELRPVDERALEALEAELAGKVATLRSPGKWGVSDRSSCDPDSSGPDSSGFVVRCAIGKGKAVLVGDADLLNWEDRQIDPAANLHALIALTDSLRT